MHAPDDPTTIDTLEALEALYGEPSRASIVKEAARLTPSYERFIARAPFVVVATSDGQRIDTSPRGDGPGFVHVLSPTRLVLPDRRGNNRIDSLRNVIVNPSLSLLFLIPGINETLRLRGRGAITADAAFCGRFTVDGKVPASALLIDIERVYFQCARALVRSRLWDPATHADRADVPSAGAMLKDADTTFDGDGYDAELADRQAHTLY